MTRWRSPLWLAAALLIAGCPRDAAPPSLLLVTLDTTRPDAFGAYGNPGGHTPHFDRLAREGVVFENAVAPMATTFPSHASVLTGLYPRRHRLRSNFGHLEGSFETLAERLRARGYQTAAWVSFESMLSRGSLHQGFDLLSHPVTGRPAGFPKSGDEVNRRAVPWLRARKPGRPFFAWVHYFEPHCPYRLTPYAASELRGYSGPLAEGASIETFYQLGDKIPWTDAERRAIRILYDGEVREADRLVGELLRALEDAGVYERTIVLVTADHGQHLGEYDRVGHASSLFEVGLRVPLLIRDPREAGAKRVATRVGLVDLAPTLLELLGAEVPQDLDGRSLAEAVRGGPLAERIYFSEVEDEALPGYARGDTSAIALYRGSLKGVLREGRFAAYDLERDPEELHPLAPDQLRESGAELERLANGYHPAPEGARTPPAPELTEELRALGYLR
jgi:arylsulfatase A-like enzyme